MNAGLDALRCVTGEGNGIVCRSPGRLLLILGDGDVWESLATQIGPAPTSGDFLGAARQIPWPQVGGGYVAILQRGGSIEIEGSGDCDLIINDQRLPVDRAAGIRLSEVPETLNAVGSGLPPIPFDARGLAFERGSVAASGFLLAHNGVQKQEYHHPGTDAATTVRATPLAQFEVFDIHQEPSARRPALPIGTQSFTGGPTDNQEENVRGPVGHLLVDDDTSYHLSHDYTVGRSPSGQNSTHSIVLVDDDISRDHARIYVEGSTVYALDLGSTNGTRYRRDDQSYWTDLIAEVPVAVLPGTRLVFGQNRSLTYEPISNS